MVDDKGGSGILAGEIVAGNALAHGLTVPNDRYAWSFIEGGKAILEFTRMAMSSTWARSSGRMRRSSWRSSGGRSSAA